MTTTSVQGHSRAPAVVIIFALIIAGGILYYFVDQLGGDVGTKAAQASSPTAVAIHEAAMSGDLKGVLAKIQSKTPVDVPYEGSEKWREGMTPLMSAAVAGKSDIVKALLGEKANVDATARDGKTALIYAAGWGDASTVEALLAAQARVDARSNDGWTAVMMAAARGTPQSVRALVQKGANVNVKNKWGQSPLVIASRTGELDKVRVLLDAGANVNDRDQTGTTALGMAAAAESGLDVMKALIEAKADVNQADNDGITPLMKAADRGDKDKVILLLNHGARPELKDSSGKTALDWARGRDDDAGRAVAALLSEAKGS
ncbi:MAG: ankyrin repeat domain-containing protein [Planctomycetota bacterium]|nr:ankyrin repeat domain-containing protein [Planctomycetota bacterium]